MNRQKKTRSRYIKTKSGKSLYLSKSKTKLKPNKKLIKSFDALQKIENKNTLLNSNKHYEYKDKKIYNCATSCDIIDIVYKDCSKGLFTALCIKSALCIKDLEMRINTNNNHQTPNNIKKDIYGIYENSSIKNNILVMNNKKIRHVFVPLISLNEWKQIMSLLKEPINQRLFKNTSFKHGLWYDIGESKVVNELADKPMNLEIGIHTIHGKNVKLDYSKRDFNNKFLIPMNRVYSCLSQVIKSYKLCKPSEIEIRNVYNLVNQILKNRSLNQIDWNRLADTFMGGLFEFTHNEKVIRDELNVLKNIHYLQNYTRVKNVLNDYIQGIS